MPADHRDNLFSLIEEDRGARGMFNDRAREHARIAQFVARWGAAGLRVAIAVGAGGVLVAIGLAIHLLL